MKQPLSLQFSQKRTKRSQKESNTII